MNSPQSTVHSPQSQGSSETPAVPGEDTWEVSGEQIEAILSRMPPNERAHHESLLQMYREGKTQVRHEDKLRKAGLIVVRPDWNAEHPTSNIQHPTSNENGTRNADRGAEMVVPSYVESAAELAQVLDTYFRERISIEISPTVVGQWRKGLRVGHVFIDGKKVIPPSLPKNKSGNRFVTQPCIDWVEKWIVPQKAVDSQGLRVDGGAGAPGSAMDFDRIKQEHAIWQMQREKDLSDGKFKSVEVFNQHIAALFSAINRALNAAEKELQKGKTPEAMMESVRAAIIREVNAAKESDGNVVE